MRTEDELRAALTAREEQVPSASSVLAGARQAAARHRRTRVAGIAAATLAVAAVVATPVLLAGPGPTPDPGPAPAQPAAQGTVLDEHAADRPDFFFTVQPDAVAGYEITPGLINPTWQVLYVTPVGASEAVASVTFYRPGSNARAVGLHAGPPLGPADGTAAQVNGAAARFLADTNNDGVAYSVLGWEYAPDGWAELGTLDGATPLTMSEAVAFAEALRFVDPYPIRVPVKLDYVPSRYRLGYAGAGIHLSYSVLTFAGPEAEALGDFDVILTDASSMTGNFPAYDEWSWEPVTMGGRAGRCADLVDGRRCELVYGEVLVTLAVTNLTATELDAVVAGLTLADPADPSTWFAITDAVPTP